MEDNDRDESVDAREHLLNDSNYQNQIVELKDRNEDKEKHDKVETKVETKAAPPIPMPSVGHTTQFPRTDNVYKKKESLPYDEAQALVWKTRPIQHNRERLIEWSVYFVIGALIGTIAFIMKILEENLIHLAMALMGGLIKTEPPYEPAPAWLVYICMCGLYGLIAGYLTTYWGQPASGSGVAELIGYINGVNYHGFLGISTLLVKVFGVSFAVSGKLCVGKEGPLAHIGAICGALVLYTPFVDLRHLQNDETKRVFVAAGASAGVAVAFGSPIGGALFVYELSRPNTFWQFKMIWKVFFCCCISTFTMAVWSGIVTAAFKKREIVDWSGASVKFGHLQNSVVLDIHILLPSALIIGVIGGLMGPLFININTRVNVFRGKILKSKWIKVLETAFFCMLTASFFFWMPYIFRRDVCPFRETHEHEPTNSTIKQIEDLVEEKQAWCKDEKTYSPLATVFWASESEIITGLMGNGVDIELHEIFVFFAVWYVFTCITYGTNVPAGLFLPGMILGCCVGRIFGNLLLLARVIENKPEVIQNAYQNLIVIASASVLAGYTRMTYSLCVIMMETA